MNSKPSSRLRTDLLVAASVLLVFLVTPALPGESAPDTPKWPGFLGAGAGEVDAESIPLEWSESKNLAWQADLAGYGQSSPVVWGDRVFVTSIDGPEKERCLVTALALADGSKLWQKSFDASVKTKWSYFVSKAAPTPAVDADALYVFFESGDLVAYSHDDGEELWRRSLSKEYGEIDSEFGLAASPAQTKDRLFVLVDNEGASYLLAVEKRTGKEVWRTERTSRQSWSSPAIVPVDGVPCVVCSSEGSVDGYSAETGERLWSFDDVGGNTAATPLPFGDGRFLVGAGAGRGGRNAASARKSNFAMHVARDGDEVLPEVTWRTEEATPTFGSPVVHAGHAYWVNRAGVVYCYDSATGEQRYAERVDAQTWATPLGVGDRVYLFGKDGNTVVLAAGPEFRVLARNQLWDASKIAPDPKAGENEESEERRRSAAMFAKPVQYAAAAVPGTLLVRRGRVLYALRNGSAPE